MRWFDKMALSLSPYKGVNKKVIIRGVLSYLPFALCALGRGRGAKGTGGTDSARYCYSVWLRHLSYLRQNQDKFTHPVTIAELGPGDSLGIGIAALISGSERYYALDVIHHADRKRDLEIFDLLVKLFKGKVDIPDEREYPNLKPALTSYSFPKDSFDWDELLSQNRLDLIRRAIEHGKAGRFVISYKVPWSESDIESESFDLIFSQAVLEHIPDVESVYGHMFDMLKRGGLISQCVDYSAHEVHRKWNGHWYIGEWLWEIIMHGRSYQINRVPHSIHKLLMERQGFRILTEVNSIDPNSYNLRNALTSSFMDEDFLVRSSFMQAKKS